jgi:predicted transcriptional regulator
VGAAGVERAAALLMGCEVAEKEALRYDNDVDDDSNYNRVN